MLERQLVIDTPGRYVTALSEVEVRQGANKEYRNMYKRLTAGVRKKSELFSPYDRLGTVWHQMREEGFLIENADLLPVPVVNGIHSAWETLAVVWLQDHAFGNKSSEIISEREAEQLQVFFPLERYRKEMPLTQNSSVDPEINKINRIKYARILKEAEFLDGCTCFQMEDPEGYLDTVRGFIIGTNIAWDRYTFLSTQA